MVTRALVTGCSGSVGYQIARDLAERHEVVACYRTRSERIENLERLGAQTCQCDLLDYERISQPRLDIDVLINCAGINLVQSDALGVSLDDWQLMLATNLTAPFLLSKAVLPGMVSRGWGRIVNVGSIYSVVGSATNSAYNASKHGLSGLTKSLAHEFGSHGVTVNEVLPGAINSDMMDQVAIRKGPLNNQSATEYLATVASLSPVPRLASVEDVSAAVQFLTGDSAAYVNGASLVVDGGRIA